MDYMKFAAHDKYVASVSTATTNIPATDAAAATVKGYEAGGDNAIFREYSKKFAVAAARDTGLSVHRDRLHQDGPGHPERRRSPRRRWIRSSRTSTPTKKSNNYFE